MNLFTLFFYVFIFYNEPIQSISVKPFHLHLTPEERRLLYGNTDRKKVPVYELVRVAHSVHTTNSSKCVRFFVFDENVELKLIKSDRLLFSKKTPIWFAETTKTNISYTRVPPDSLHDALEFYEDPDNMAGIDIKSDDQGNLQFTGYIRNRLELRKVPQRVYDVWTQLFSKSRHRVIRSPENYNTTDYHIVIDRSIPDDVSDALRIIPGLRRERSVQKISNQSIFFRILLFVDYNGLELSYQDSRFYQILIYLICFWNAVDIKYHEFQNPAIRFHMAGIVIRKQTTANRYETLNWIDPRAKNIESTMDGFVEFIRENDPMPRGWDVAVSQTDMLMDGKDINQKTVGIAFLGTSCRLRSLSMALIYDKRDFTSISVAAHEVGHILGAGHDGGNFSMCNDHGYIMSPVISIQKLESESWSWCSKEEILARLRSTAKKCWKDTPTIQVDDLVSEILPGHITGVQDQCISKGYDYACEEELTNCESLFCWSATALSFLGLDDFLKTCRNSGAPLPGTSCGENMHCKHEVCVPRTSCNGSEI